MSSQLVIIMDSEAVAHAIAQCLNVTLGERIETLYIVMLQTECEFSLV